MSQRTLDPRMLDTDTALPAMSGAALTGLPSDWVLLTTSNASGSGVDFTLQNATYSSYCWHLENVGCDTDGTYIGVRTSTDGGSSFSSSGGDYYYSGTGHHSAVGHNGIANTSADEMLFNSVENRVGNAANEHVSGTIYCFNPADTEYTQFGANLHGMYINGHSSWYIGTGHRLSAADVDAVQIKPNGGTFNDGRIKMYGIK